MDVFSFADTVMAEIAHDSWLELMPERRFKTIGRVPVRREFVCDRVGIDNILAVLRCPKMSAELDARLRELRWENDLCVPGAATVATDLRSNDPVRAAVWFVRSSTEWMNTSPRLVYRVGSNPRQIEEEWLESHMDQIVARLRKLAVLRPSPLGALNMAIANNARTLIYAECCGTKHPLSGSTVVATDGFEDAHVHKSISTRKASVVVVHVGDGDLRDFYRHDAGWSVVDFEATSRQNSALGQVAARLSSWSRKQAHPLLEEPLWPELFA